MYCRKDRKGLRRFRFFNACKNMLQIFGGVKYYMLAYFSTYFIICWSHMLIYIFLVTPPDH